MHDSDRQRNRFLIDDVFIPWFKARTTAAALKALDKARIPSAKVDDMAEVSQNPQIKSREMVIYRDYPGIGPVPMPGVVPKLSLTPGDVHRTAPRPGEHNAAVYHQMLRISTPKLASLKKKGII